MSFSQIIQDSQINTVVNNNDKKNLKNSEVILENGMSDSIQDYNKKVINKKVTGKNFKKNKPNKEKGDQKKKGKKNCAIF